MSESKRLGRLLNCPICHQRVNPSVVTTYREIQKPDKSVIPSRTVLQCPIDGCPAVWYVPVWAIEELPLVTDV
jgi:hypothetical protein